MIQILQPNDCLKGNRIVLKKPEATIAFAYTMFTVIQANREHILPWLDWALPEKTQSAEDDFIYALEAVEDWQKGERFEYAVYDAKSGVYLGSVAVMQCGRPVDKTWEIGYWLCREACGKGLAQEAIRLLEQEFFSLGVERMIIRNATENVKSRRVAERCGYHFEGVMRHGRYSEALQKFVDVNVFSKLRQDYCE